MSFNRLRWADEPPRTVGDVMKLLAGHRVGQIKGLGPGRVEGITQALTGAGLNPAIRYRKGHA